MREIKIKKRIDELNEMLYVGKISYDKKIFMLEKMEKMEEQGENKIEITCMLSEEILNTLLKKEYGKLPFMVINGKIKKKETEPEKIIEEAESVIKENLITEKEEKKFDSSLKLEPKKILKKIKKPTPPKKPDNSFKKGEVEIIEPVPIFDSILEIQRYLILNNNRVTIKEWAEINGITGGRVRRAFDKLIKSGFLQVRKEDKNRSIYFIEGLLPE